MSWSEVAAAIAASDVSLCITLLANLTEPERRAMAADAMKVYREAHGERGPRRGVAFLAMLGTATLAEIKKAPLSWCESTVYDVLAARRPAWLGDWTEWVLSEPAWAWNVVRRMVREGLCGRPASDMYYLRMLEAAAHTPKQFLLSDPELLECEIWELFRIEGTSDLSLSGIEKYGRREAWVRTFVELAAEGKISRERLLDRSLDALESDFHQFRAGWFSRFHEALEPTTEERAARSERYLRLIASRIPPTVSLALRAVQTLCRAGRVAPADVLNSVPPAFYAKEKGTVSLALKLLDHCVAVDARLGAAAGSVALPALEHASADVREAALGFINAQGVAVTAPSPAPPVHPEAPPALPEKEPAGPILTVEELTLRLSKALENEGPPDELERVLDGVSRLCALRPPEFARLTAPLGKRAELLLAKSTRGCFRGHSVRALFCGLATAWLSGKVPESQGEPAPGLAGFLGARVREVAERAAAGVARPLSSIANVPHDERRVEFGWHRRDNDYHETRFRIEPPLPAVIPLDQPSLLAYTTRCENAEMLRWTTMVCPGNREGWFTAGCRAVGNNLDWWSAEWQNRVFFEPLLDSAQPFGKMGLILISLGLAAKEAGEGTLAADVLAASITDVRMTADVCGEMLARLFSWEHIKIGRVVARLGQVARFSELHRSVIREGIAAGLAETSLQPAALGAVLELLYELSAGANSVTPRGKLRELLAAQRGSNRAAAVARKLLSLRE